MTTRLPFFFKGSSAHRDLHSFPTRRSSDLLHVGVHAPSDALDLHRLGATHPLAIDIDRPRATELEDRKSTRLNSSHRCISYAVFCLKKKKHNITQSASMSHLYVAHFPSRVR